MDNNELFALLRSTERALRRLGIKGDDFRLPDEVRQVALALEEGKFDEARAYVKALPETIPPTNSCTLPDEVLVLLNHIELVVDSENWEKIDTKLWNAVTSLAKPN
jgi:hypothetical protein